MVLAAMRESWRKASVHAIPTLDGINGEIRTYRREGREARGRG